MAHLMRRAGFGATRDELEEHAARDYEAVVEDLLDPERFPGIEEDLLLRYGRHEDWMPYLAGEWIYRMVNTRRPLEEKMALFFHHVFATGHSKVNHNPSMIDQNRMFRRVAFSDLRTVLTELSRDVAMIVWLDNNENHKDEPNENYGRELLELFSMGVDNYTEDDIKAATRAFTGWTLKWPIPGYPHGEYRSGYAYLAEDHDDGEKTFLGETGRFNGEDIIDIVVKQPATARFLARHLYDFFVADEPPVATWNKTPPQDPEAIDALVDAYFESNGSIRSMLRVLFNAGFFKQAQYEKIKSPTEFLVGILKLAGTHRFPTPDIEQLSDLTTGMGQTLYNPPTVEGWHTGQEWIDGGALDQRVNFAADEVGDATKPGIRLLVDRLCTNGSSLSPDEFVDRSLDLIGPVVASDETRNALMRFAESGGELAVGTRGDRERGLPRIMRMFQLVVASREYQLA